jgi:perosamine synthetase
MVLRSGKPRRLQDRALQHLTMASPSPAARSQPDAFEAAFVERLRSLVGGGADFVALHEPQFSGEEWTLVKDCLDTGWVSSVGKYVDEFEARVAEACGAKYAIAVANGTAALHIAMLVAGVKPGDEVIIPALTFVATANAVSHAGAIPHLVDSSFETLGMDPAALRTHLETITGRRGGETFNRETGRRIAAVVPMHAFGHPVDMDALLDVSGAFGLPVIEDAAESIGSLYKGRPTGAIGRIGTLSFNGNKIITTGGGGAIVTNDPELARHAKHLTTTAKVAHKWAFFHDEVGFNYRMPNINAALGVAQLAQLDGLLADKRRLAERYIAGFGNFGGLSVVREPAFARSNYWLNAVLLDDDHADRRDALLEAANAAGLQCRPTWTLMHRLPMYEAAPRAPLPVAESIERRLINIPSSAKLGAVDAA